MVPNLLKPSQLGGIPKDWKRVRLSEVMKVRQGLQIAISERLKAPTSTSKEYITIQSIKKTDQDREYVEAPSQRVICTRDDVLMTRTGNTGIVVTDVEGAFHNNFFLMDFDKDKIDKTFLVNYLRSPRVQHLILTKAGASTIPDLNHKDFYSVEFPLAPVLEQKKIAKILSTWDKAISTTERLIENSTQQKKALMQQLLTGKKRLLDESREQFEGEWEEVKLGSICLKVTDGAHHSPQSVETGYPMYSVKDMTSSGFRKNSARLISKGDFDKLVNQNCKPELNDILIAKDGSILKYCFVVKEKVEGVILSSIALLRPNLKKVFPEFIAQYFSQEYVRFFVGKALTSGSGVPRIVLKDFKGIQIALPSIKEQQKIATVLTNADKEIELLEQQLADLQQEKKALMQVLLTGKKRVVVDEC